MAVGQELTSIFMVMEYCEHDLATLLDNMAAPFSPSDVKCLMQQLLDGLEYCHSRFIVHRFGRAALRCQVRPGVVGADMGNGWRRRRGLTLQGPEDEQPALEQSRYPQDRYENNLRLPAARLLC